MNTQSSQHIVYWNGYTIAVTYIPNWMGSHGDFVIAHLEVETITPPRAPLPFTETGYRSHFPHPDEVAAHGGPVGYVTEWLNVSAKDHNWKATHAANQQLDLFRGG